MEQENRAFLSVFQPIVDGTFLSPFPFFSFDSVVFGQLSFIFFLFFLSYYTIRGELFLRGGWSGVRGHLGRLHYSLSMSLSDQNPVDIGAEFGFLPNLITNCIIIGTGIGGKKCRLMYNPGQITADGKSVSYWTSSNISQPTYILYTSSVCIYRFKTLVTFLSLSLQLAPHDSSTSFDPFEILFEDGTKGIAARGESYTWFFHEWSTSSLSLFFSYFFLPLVLASYTQYRSLPLLRTRGCTIAGLEITYQPPTPPPLCCLLPHRLSLFFLSIPPTLNFIFSSAGRAYTFPRFYLWQTIEKRRLEFGPTGIHTRRGTRDENGQGEETAGTPLPFKPSGVVVTTSCNFASSFPHLLYSETFFSSLPFFVESTRRRPCIPEKHVYCMVNILLRRIKIYRLGRSLLLFGSS